jgi:hypothetical protein
MLKSIDWNIFNMRNRLPGQSREKKHVENKVSRLVPDKVAIEAASHDLLSRHSAPVVAVSFDWGKGHVFHVISHFWCKRSRTPTQRHQGPCTDFLKAGMKLSDDSINKVLAIAQIKADTLNFAQLQSAVTSTELIAQLCIRAARAVPAKQRSGFFAW